MVDGLEEKQRMIERPIHLSLVRERARTLFSLRKSANDLASCMTAPRGGPNWNYRSDGP